MKDLYYFFRMMLKIFYKMYFRFEVCGHHNIPDEGGVLIAANHLSYLDPPLVGISIKRKASFIAHSGLFNIPLIGKFIESFSIPIDRDNPKPSTIKEAVSRLKNGELVVMFPEGTRSPSGEDVSGKRGAASIAGMSRATIIPTLIEGTGKALPIDTKFIKPFKVRITFGKPLTRNPGESEKEFQQSIEDDLMDTIKNLRES
ncbi:MAG: lysophospholipid acyltransferase family protein [Thermodesulfovibrionales bacterium]